MQIHSLMFCGQAWWSLGLPGEGQGKAWRVLDRPVLLQETGDNVTVT